MADEEARTPDATDGGEQSDQGRVFTQADVDRLMGERVKREREKYADYADLKKAAARLAEIEEANKSELQKAQEAAQAAQHAAEAALTAANERLMRAAFIAEAAKAGAAHPEDAYALAERSAVKVGDDGTVMGVAEAVKALTEAGRLVMAQGPRAPHLDGNAGGGDRPSEKKTPLTPEQLDVANRMRIPPDEYAKYLKPN